MGYTRISQIAEGKNIPALNEDEKVVKTLAAGGGGGGDTLPAVTEADNGNVLTVVDGAWGKAAPSGGTLSSYFLNLSLNNENNETIPAGGIKFWTFSGNLSSNIPPDAIPIRVNLDNGSFDDKNYIATGWNVYVNDGQVSGNVWIQNLSSTQSFAANSSNIDIVFLALS